MKNLSKTLKHGNNMSTNDIICMAEFKSRKQATTIKTIRAETALAALSHFP